MKIHPLCLSSTDIPTDEFERLKLDIQERGQRQPILIWDDQVIDGRHRLRACEEIGRHPDFQDVTLLVVESDLPAYVRSLNDHRRHETPAQRIESAMRIEGKPIESMAQEGHSVPPEQKTAPEIAREAEVSQTTVKEFKRVKRNAAPAIQKAMMEGQISIKKASTLSKLPKVEQQRLAKAGVPVMDARAAADLKASRVLGSAAYVDLPPDPPRPPEWKAEVIKVIEALYDRNRAQWNNPPPPPPRMIIDLVLKIVREM